MDAWTRGGDAVRYVDDGDARGGRRERCETSGRDVWAIIIFGASIVLRASFERDDAKARDRGRRGRANDARESSWESIPCSSSITAPSR